MPGLIVASNRVPDLASGSDAGGLAVALEGFLRETGGTWFGWSGEVSDTPGSVPAITQADGFRLATLDLSPAELRGYYEEFANRALWPLLHGRLDLARFDHQSYAAYRAVNRRFAESMRPLVGPDQTVWVHDYHLIPLGSELRRRGVANPLGFFLHIPLPPPQSMEALPWLEGLAHDLCSYDLIGFQTSRCLRNFCDLVTRKLGGDIAEDGTVTLDGRSVRAAAFPISIDTGAVETLAGSPAVRRQAEELRRRLGDRSWLLGVDRLDYTKGLPRRVEAFRTLIEQHPELRARVSLLQIAAPSREGIHEYREVQAELESLVAEVNGSFGRVDWTPVRYLHKSLSHARLAALYQCCPVGLVTPLRDGMNLVAKEYVAAQDPEDPGCLVLSRFAGAAEELTEAILVNPYDTAATANAIRTAVAMPLAERRRRWESMMRVLRRNDVHRWRRDFLSALRDATRGAQTVPSRTGRRSDPRARAVEPASGPGL